MVQFGRIWLRRGRNAVYLTAVVLAMAGGCISTSNPTPPPVTDADHILANGTPPVTVIEYGDFQCPVCGAFFQQTYPTIKSEYVDTGKVRWVFREFPLTSVHPRALPAAIAAECAAQQGKFFEYHDLLFAMQQDLSDDALRTYASAVGLDVAAFNACFDSQASLSRVQTDIDGGTNLGITGTPTFFIDDQEVKGLQSVEQMRALLDAALASKGE